MTILRLRVIASAKFTWTQSPLMLEFGRCVRHPLTHNRQAFQNEPHPLCTCIKSCSHALTPVPSATGHAEIIAPNHFSFFRRLERGSTFLDRIEPLRTLSNG